MAENPTPQAPNQLLRKYAAAVASGLLLLLAATSVRAYSIPSASMSPTLHSGDRVLTVLAPLSGTPRRGEVWVFTAPRQATAGRSNWVKRVVGVPGDTVQVKGKQVLINGKALSEPYLAAPPSYAVGPVTLQEDEFFMLGDNRDNSNDSHVWGPVPRSAFVGKVGIRYWPLGRAGNL